MKNQKGISLITVIITIIVILILAGVSISLGLDDNGILENSQEASEKTVVSQSKEYIMEAWAYVLSNVDNNQMPYNNTSLKTHRLADKLLRKHLKDYGTAYLESENGNYIYFINVDGNTNISTYKINFTLKGKKEPAIYYIVNDTKIYSEDEIT